MELSSKKLPFINCHTHTFTGDNIPPYLGKKLLPFPLGYLLTIPMIVGFFRWWFRVPYKIQFTKFYIGIRSAYYRAKIFIGRFPLLSVLIGLIATMLSIDGFFILYHSIAHFVATDHKSWIPCLDKGESFLIYWSLLPAAKHIFLRLFIVVLVLLCIPSGRNLIFFLLKMIFQFFKFLPGPKTKAYIARYLSIGRFAFHQKQRTVFETLCHQYPLQTKFVILPMDMDYIEAGTPKCSYPQQLEELKELQRENPDTILPFVFADPRRIANDNYYYSIILDCIEKGGFRGIKTYPALGYYPFDQDLLELMFYACEHEIPVLNHCIRGVIFYRGVKKPEWNYHPLFLQSTGVEGEFEPLELFETKNLNFTPNFTHPLNYLCLLDEQRLRKLLIHYQNKKLFELFGYTDDETPLKKNLSNLKVCFGHFGGEDEWARYLQADRYQPDNAIIFHPKSGIDFSKDSALESIWKYTSWYSIIYSLMLQYPNVYADISYILYDDNTYHLLKTTLLKQSGISDKVLFGTDFYVVRSQKSDKQMWADMVGVLTEEQLNQIAIENPRKFLDNRIHGPIL